MGNGAKGNAYVDPRYVLLLVNNILYIYSRYVDVGMYIFTLKSAPIRSPTNKSCFL